MTSKSKSKVKLKALVTGGAGFIGSHVVDQLVDDGYDVYVLKSGFRSGKHPDVVNKEAHVIEGSLTNRDDMRSATKDIDVVFHLGAVLSHYAEMYPDLAFDVNVKGTWYLKEMCHLNNVKHIIFSSTSFVYGDPDYTPVSEYHPLKPKGNFEVGKLAAEKILQAVHPFQVPYTILRLFNVYGPRSYPDGVYSQAITTFILKALKKESLELHADGRQELDFVYVKDVARAFSCAASNPEAIGQVFNVGSGTSTSISFIARLINSMTDNDYRVHFNKEHPAYLHCVRADLNHTTDVLGWAPETQLTKGLQETVQFFRGWNSDIENTFRV